VVAEQAVSPLGISNRGGTCTTENFQRHQNILMQSPLLEQKPRFLHFFLSLLLATAIENTIYTRPL
jgi:hypothetical protein